ncbi:MAG: hypothetical protein DI630_00045 [Gordonia sp. (in: high G+C Gram-positive bacteria)]|nr:MAG: hypothetical protein DI630_00045 [Gordonia sp. (in: high G+C Gram-positive bacteria)]
MTIDSHRLSEVFDDLLDGWVQSKGDHGPTLTDLRGRTEQQIAAVMTMTAHAHATALVLRPVLPDGLTIAHMPLVRAVFEATITAVWCDEVADGANALINEGSRQRRNLRKELGKTRSMAEMAEKINTGAGSLPTTSEQQAKRIEARCSEVSLDGAYAVYRMLSGLGHASIDTMDAYLDEGSFTPGHISIKSNSGPLDSSFAWAHLVASCLVWSGRVVDFLDPARSRRSALQRAARALDINDLLRVDYNASARGRNG